MASLQKEVQELQAKWYEYVSLDHHKDRDCHFYVNLDFAYDGTDIDHEVTHHGYIYHNELRLEGKGADFYPTLKKAILTVIKDQEVWVNDVLESPGDWDEWQIEQAKKYKELFDGYKEREEV